MTALAGDRRIREETWAYQTYKLPTGKTAFKGGLAVYDQSVAKCIPMETGAAQTDLFVLGFFNEQVVNTSGADKNVVVRLKREITVRWFANDATNPVTANDIGKQCFGVDDQTASNSSATSTRSTLGVAWAIDAVKGVAVEIS
jgi:hypothetical protein